MVQTIRREFGQSIKEKRSQLHMTQTNLACMLNISSTYLREIEHGIHTPNWIDWLMICTALNIDPENFIDMID